MRHTCYVSVQYTNELGIMQRSFWNNGVVSNAKDTGAQLGSFNQDVSQGFSMC